MKNLSIDEDLWKLSRKRSVALIEALRMWQGYHSPERDQLDSEYKFFNEILHVLGGESNDPAGSENYLTATDLAQQRVKNQKRAITRYHDGRKRKKNA